VRSTGPLRHSEFGQSRRSQHSPPASDRLLVAQPSGELAVQAFFLLGGLFLLTSCVAVMASRGLVADGAFYFIELLRRPRPSTFEHGRLAAHALTQWPLVVAVELGVTHFLALRLIHSFGLFYLGPLHLMLCWWFVRRGEERDLFWPLLSLFAGSINAWFVVMTEAHVLTWLFWPLVLFLLHGQLRDRIQAAVFGLLVIASALTYETMALQGLFLAGLAVARCREKSITERWFWTVIAGWFLLGAGVGAYFAVNPRSPENRGGFLTGLLQFAGTGRGDLNYPVLLSFTVLALVAIVLLRGPFRRRIFQTLLTFLTAAGILIAMWPIFNPESLRPVQQFQARAWIGLLPVGLAVLMLLLRRRVPQPAAFRMALGFLIALGLSQITWQMVATAQWYGYTRVFREELDRHTGFVPYESSALARDRIGIQALRNLTWNYTNVYMSIALARSGQVASIIGVPKGMWQPFDPTDAKALPELGRYAVDYSRYVQALGAR
jgi:hypothetical protein